MWHKESGQSEKLTKKRERCECELSVQERIVRNVLKCFGHVERIGDERLVNRVYRANGEGNKGGGEEGP